MATFTIDSENNIAAHPAVPGNLENLQTFATYKDLAKLAAEWSGSRLVAIWNSFAGVAPFTDLLRARRCTSKARILRSSLSGPRVVNWAAVRDPPNARAAALWRSRTTLIFASARPDHSSARTSR